MNGDTANLSKASNKKVKKIYQVLSLWQGGFWLVACSVCGKVLTSTSAAE